MAEKNISNPSEKRPITSEPMPADAKTAAVRTTAKSEDKKQTPVRPMPAENSPAPKAAAAGKPARTENKLPVKKTALPPEPKNTKPPPAGAAKAIEPATARQNPEPNRPVNGERKKTAPSELKIRPAEERTAPKNQLPAGGQKTPTSPAAPGAKTASPAPSETSKKETLPPQSGWPQPTLKKTNPANPPATEQAKNKPVNFAPGETKPTPREKAPAQPRIPSRQRLWPYFLNQLARLRAQANQKRARKAEENLKKIMAYAREKQKITNDEVEKITGVHDRQALNYLNILVKKGLLIRFGTKKNTFYRPLKF